MMSQTHLLICAATLTRPERRAQNIAVLVGSLIPDISLFIMPVYARLNEVKNLWRAPDGLYWIEPWQSYSAIENSFPLYLAIVAIALLVIQQVARPFWRWVALIALFFALSAIIHLACDFFVHADDAHVHFWPFSEWRFHSPISYWDPRHYGRIGSFVEIFIGIGCAVVIWRRFSKWWVRALIVPPALIGPASFIAMLFIRGPVF